MWTSPRGLDLGKGAVGKLKKCMYGTHDAGAIWDWTYTWVLLRMGCVQWALNPCRSKHPRVEVYVGGARGRFHVPRDRLQPQHERSCNGERHRSGFERSDKHSQARYSGTEDYQPSGPCHFQGGCPTRQIPCMQGCVPRSLDLQASKART